MRNLKRVLSLVLALMMTFSLMVFTTSASAAESATIPVASTMYSDYDEINPEYKEAVDVMTAIEIVDGTGEGDAKKLNPTDELTRAEATKILTYLLQPTMAEAMNNVPHDTQFADVQYDHWAASYINFCATMGVVSGHSPTEFDPNGTLTGVAFGKMLLVALGYKADDEGYTGNNWTLNVATALLNAGIDYQEAGIDLADSLNREEAMEMAFLAIQAPLVEYPGMTISQSAIATANGASYKTSTVANAQNISSKRLTAGLTNASLYLVEFAEEKFQKLVLRDTVDAFGRPTHTWKYNNVEIGAYDTNDRLIVTYDREVTAADVVRDLGSYYVRLASGEIVSIENVTKRTTTTDRCLYENSTVPSALTIGEQNDADETVSQTVAKAIANRTANGKLVEVWVGEDNVVNHIVDVTYTAGVLSISKTANGDRTNYSVSNPNLGIMNLIGTDYTSDDLLDSVVIEEGYEIQSGDIVTCTQIDDVLYIYQTTKMTGIQSAKTEDPSMERTWSLTIDGEKYTLGYLGVKGVFEKDFLSGSNSASFYLDQFGCVVYTGERYLSYAYVVAASGDLHPGLTGNEPSVKVRAVQEDGTVGDYNVALTKVINDTVKNQVNRLPGDKNAEVGNWVIANTSIVVYRDENNGYDEPEEVDAIVKNALVRSDSESSEYDPNTIYSDKGEEQGFTVWDYAISGSDITLYPLTEVTSSTQSLGIVENPYYMTSNIQKGITSAQKGGVTFLMNAQTTFVYYDRTTQTAKVYAGNTKLPESAKGAKIIAVATDGGSRKELSALVFATYDSESSENLSYAYLLKDSASKLNDKTTTYKAYTADGTAITLNVETSEIGTKVPGSGVYAYDTDTNAIKYVLACAESSTPSSRDALGGKTTLDFLARGRLTTMTSTTVAVSTSNVAGGYNYDPSSPVNTTGISSSTQGVTTGQWAYVVVDGNDAKAIFIVEEPTGTGSGSASVPNATLNGGTVTIPWYGAQKTAAEIRAIVERLTGETVSSYDVVSGNIYTSAGNMYTVTLKEQVEIRLDGVVIGYTAKNETVGTISGVGASTKYLINAKNGGSEAVKTSNASGELTGLSVSASGTINVYTAYSVTFDTTKTGVAVGDTDVSTSGNFVAKNETLTVTFKTVGNWYTIKVGATDKNPIEQRYDGMSTTQTVKVTVTDNVTITSVANDQYWADKAQALIEADGKTYDIYFYHNGNGTDTCFADPAIAETICRLATTGGNTGIYGMPDLYVDDSETAMLYSLAHAIRQDIQKNLGISADQDATGNVLAIAGNTFTGEDNVTVLVEGRVLKYTRPISICSADKSETLASATVTWVIHYVELTGNDGTDPDSGTFKIWNPGDKIPE